MVSNIEIESKLDMLVDSLDSNKHEILQKIEEIREDKREQINSILDWIKTQSKHCHEAHSKLDISFTELQTDYKNTKELVMSRKDFGGKLTIVLISSIVSIFMGLCSWIFKILTTR